MTVQQISVFMENRAGQMVQITNLLSERKLTLRAVSIAETRDYGILRLLADDPEKVTEALHEKGYIFSVTPINAIPVSDEPGGLNDLLAKISKAGIDVQYMYSVYSLEDHIPYMMVRVEDPAALDALLAK
jgi:hypothetical protein